MDATIAGLLVASVIGAIGLGVAYRLRRSSLFSPGARALVVCIFWVAVALLAPSPSLGLLAVLGVRVIDLGHAASNFVLPYFAMCLAFLPLIIFVATWRTSAKTAAEHVT